MVQEHKKKAKKGERVTWMAEGKRERGEWSIHGIRKFSRRIEQAIQ
jgi:hypothetical protein